MRKIVQFYTTIHNHQEWVKEAESLRTESRYNTICPINHTHLSLRFRVHAKHQPSHSKHPHHHQLVYSITVFNRRGATGIPPELFAILAVAMVFSYSCYKIHNNNILSESSLFSVGAMSSHPHRRKCSSTSCEGLEL